jgi:hypothetical protein
MPALAEVSRTSELERSTQVTPAWLASSIGFIRCCPPWPKRVAANWLLLSQPSNSPTQCRFQPVAASPARRVISSQSATSFRQSPPVWVNHSRRHAALSLPGIRACRSSDQLAIDQRQTHRTGTSFEKCCHQTATPDATHSSRLRPFHQCPAAFHHRNPPVSYDPVNLTLIYRCHKTHRDNTPRSVACHDS